MGTKQKLFIGFCGTVVAHWTGNQVVLGSIPISAIVFFNDFLLFFSIALLGLMLKKVLISQIYYF